MINPHISMLPHITMRELVDRESPVEVRYKVLLLLHDLFLGPQLVVKGVSLLLSEPVWHLGVAHVVHFHFSGHDAEISTN